jgi:hypothetical protein
MRIVPSLVIVALVAGTLASWPSAASTRSYNAAAEFSLAHNPNGVWSYRGAGSLLPLVASDCDRIGLVCRWNGRPVCNSAIVGAGKGHRPAAFMTVRLPADHLEMDPEGVRNVSVRWTAPAAATFEIRGDFLGVDTTGNAHPVSITSGSNVLYANTISSYGRKDAFDVTHAFKRGQTVDFVVSTGNSCTYLSTGLKAAITSVVP